MKTRNKVLSLILTCAMLLSVFALPFKSLVSAIAATTVTATVSTTELNVLNVKKEYDTTNNILKYSDYCTTVGAEVKVWNADGTSNFMWYEFDTADEYVFACPGVYALQYRLTSNNGVTAYSDVIYIPVSNKISDFTFDSELKTAVRPGTIVTIPQPTEQGATIKVYTPYGERVTVTDNKFTNQTNILGTYFIEYSMLVMYDSTQKEKLVYKTIEFTYDSTETNATVTPKEESDNNTVKDYTIITSGSALSAEKEFLYLYKFYDLSNVYVVNPSGEKLNDAIIYVSVYDETDKKYYNFETGEFVVSTSNEMKKDITTIGTKFELKSIDNLSNMTASGHSIKVTYTSSYQGKNLEQTITRTEKFNFDAITAKVKTLSPSEVTGIEIKSKVEVGDFELKKVWFSGVDINVEEGYDRDGLLALISSANLSVSNSLSGVSYSSAASTPREEGKEGVSIIDKGNLLLNEYELYYNKFTTKEFYFVVVYSINFKSDTNDGFSGTKRIEFRTYAREESKDQIKPYELVLGKYNSALIDTNSWVVPTLTCKDLDNDGNTTTGAVIKVYIKGFGSTYATETQVEMGQELTNLSAGNYSVRYEAVDYANNKRVKTINFKVIDNSADTAFPALSMTDMELTTDNGEYSITGTTNATYVTVYTESKSFAPKVVYKGSKVNSVIFKEPLNDTDGVENCVAVYAIRNNYGSTYKAVKVLGEVNDVTPSSIGYVSSSSSFVELVPNSTKKINVLQNLLWFGNSDFRIESEDDSYGKYIITNGNEIVFLASGTYTIYSVEAIDGSNYNSKTTVTVNEAVTSFDVKFPIGQKQVAKKGEEVEVYNPYIANYYGYDLKVYVTDSMGNVVKSFGDRELQKFTATKTDVYSVNYEFSSDNVGAQLRTIGVSTGNISKPVITISAPNENVVWTGETIKYIISGASSVDKNGTPIDVKLYCYDANGQSLTVKFDGTNYYVDVVDAGIYTIYYTSVDADGIEAISKTSFAVEFPKEKEEPKISVWGIIGIVIGSLAACAGIAFVVYIIVKNNKKKTRFINKTKQVKKQQKETQAIITITESKDEKYWIVKKDGKQVAKTTSKIDAIKKAKEVDANGASAIKVYNRNGRLVDSL